MTECRAFNCDRPRGTSDRDDYNARRYCCARCEVRTEKRRWEARQAWIDDQPEAEPTPGREP